MKHRYAISGRQLGVSLIELMIALVIASLLILGLVEVFAASRTAYQLSEGLSRVQENGRFAVDYIQRDFRLSGHLGCVNDQARFLPENDAGTRSAIASTFLTQTDQIANSYAGSAADPVPHYLRFDMPLQAYEANGTGPGTTYSLPQDPVLDNTAGNWTPALPAELSDALNNRIGGSDILVLRQFSALGAQVVSFTPGDPTATIVVNTAQWTRMNTGIPNPGLYGVADCLNAGVFHAATADAAGNISITQDGVINKSAMAGYESYVPGQASVYVAESLVYYVGLNGSGAPALFRMRFNIVPGGTDVVSDPEELVEGVESLQLRFGQDSRNLPTQRPSGNMGDSYTAATLLTPGGDIANAWRRVGLVQVGLVARSANPAAAEARDTDIAAPLHAVGVTMTPPADGRYRAVYESTIALRNRLFGH